MGKLCWIALACSVSLNAGSMTSWQKAVLERLPLYGHRNWIVIADSAYPAQSKPGVETIVAEADQITVLNSIVGMLSHSRHVTPVVYLDREIEFLSNRDVPGIEGYREQTKAMFTGKPLQELPHLEIIGKLDQVSQTFRVLIIKTKMTMPYTSVFLQLDCAYWGPEQEKSLRDRMAKAADKR